VGGPPDRAPGISSQHIHAYSIADSDTQPHSDGHSYGHSEPNSYSEPNTYGEPYTHVDPHGEFNADGYPDIDADSVNRARVWGYGPAGAQRYDEQARPVLTGDAVPKMRGSIIISMGAYVVAQVIAE
jgi:hypothetical protein